MTSLYERLTDKSRALAWMRRELPRASADPRHAHELESSIVLAETDRNDIMEEIASLQTALSRVRSAQRAMSPARDCLCLSNATARLEEAAFWLQKEIGAPPAGPD